MKFYIENHENEWLIETIHNHKPIMICSILVDVLVNLAIMSMTDMTEFEKTGQYIVLRWLHVLVASLILYVMFRKPSSANDESEKTVD